MTETVSTPAESRFQLLDLVLDLQRGTLARAGVEIELPELSFRLLAALVRCAPEALGKDDLIRQVWGDVVVSDETLSQRVRLLRQALGEDAQEPRYIASVRGRGYRLLCPVRALSARTTVPGKARWPALAAALAALLVAVWLLWPGDRNTATDIQSIAVLPFTDLSPGQDHRYFADGMQEELLSRLAGLDNLSVVSRTTVERYRDTTMSLPDIAGELGVNAIIESSVRVTEGRVRITAQLIDAGTDRHLWAEVYDRQLTVENIFAIQQEVAERIGRALALEFASPDGAKARGLPTHDLAAYDAYLVGRYHTFRQTPEDLDLAIRYLRQAVTLDPEFAEAWTALGWSYSFVGTIYGKQPPKDVYPLAKDAVTRALALDGELANARTLYADILTWYDWDFAAAEREYEKTLELDPLNVLGYALFLSTQLRHDEAIELIERRIAAAPDDPYVRINAAWTFLRARDYERAIAEAKRAPEHPDTGAVLGYASLGQGRVEDALSIFTADLQRQGRQPRQLSQLAVACFRAGRESEGHALLAELEALSRERYISPDLLAEPYFAAGDADSGFANVFEAVTVRARGAIFLQTTSMLDDYRSDPRYRIALTAVGF